MGNKNELFCRIGCIVALCRTVHADGDIVMERTLDCEVEAIDAHLRKFGQPITKLGFKAGVMSQMIFHGLQALGYDVVCMEARQVNAALSDMPTRRTKMMHAALPKLYDLVGINLCI